MDNLLELNLGYVACDVCGDGYNGVSVWFYGESDRERPFRFIRGSNCYGGIDKSNLTRDEALDLLRASSFLVATRSARKKWNKFMREFAKGTYDNGWVEPRPARASRSSRLARSAEATVDDSVVSWGPLMSESPPAWDGPSGCCASCDAVVHEEPGFPTLTNSFIRVGDFRDATWLRATTDYPVAEEWDDLLEAPSPEEDSPF